MISNLKARPQNEIGGWVADGGGKYWESVVEFSSDIVCKLTSCVRNFTPYS